MSVVDLTSRRRMRGVQAAAVRRDARMVLDLLGIDAELSIALIDDAEMHRLNATYRHKDRPTDVLSFAGEEEIPSQLPQLPRGADIASRRVLGDVVISLDTAARQAAERGIDIADEVRTLLVHGILHLLGYDHERSPAEARRMFGKQRQLLKLLTDRR